MEPREKDFKLLNVFTGVFVAVLVLIPGTSSKLIAIGPFNLPGGTLIFPLTFILNDVLTEVYGYARSRRVIWTGLGCQALAAFAYWLVSQWPSAPFWHHQEAYLAILGIGPRIALASLTAYFCGEFINSVVLSKMKYAHAGRQGLLQSWRFVASSIVGEFIDSVVFMTIAFAGVHTTQHLVEMTLTIWIAKVLIELVVLPVSVRFANWVKHVEGIDKIDRPEETNYSPFAAFSKD
jgi:hypothetical protein